MVNKLWYQEYPEETKWVRPYLQKLINLYCFDSKIFKEPEDIKLDNLQQFIEIIFKQYQHYNIHIGNILDLGDAFDFYLSIAFKDEFPEEYPSYPDTDRRQLVLDVSGNCIQSGTCWNIFPEDVPFVIECLNAPEAELPNMYDKLNKYFNQFDNVKRTNEECPKRWEAMKQERIEALQNNKPLPIRPMSITLDPCYKDNKEDPA